MTECMRWLKVFLLLSVTVIIGVSCGRSLKRANRPSTIVIPESWSRGENIPDSGRLDWWVNFSDPGLNQVVARVLERNQDLQVAAARIEVAKSDARIAGAPELPQLDLDMNWGRRRQNFVGLPIPGADGRVLSRTFTSTGISLNLGWEIDLWGKFKAGKLAAMANTQARTAELVAARLSLAAQAAKAWFWATEARRQVDLARSSVKSYQVSTRRIRARFERGIRAALDLRLALTELRIAEASLQQRLEQAERSVRQIQILMGDYPDGNLTVGDDLPKMPGQVPGGLPSELVYRRPDLVAAERDLLAADTRIIQARAQLRPSFILTSAIGTSSDQLRDLLANNLFIWSLIGNASQPIFNRGRLKAGVSKSQALANEAAARYQSSILLAYNDVESALAAEESIVRRQEALELATKQSIAARKLAEDRYRSGLAGIIILLAAQRTAIDSESQLVTVRRLRLENRVDLYLALGGEF